ncbi:Protein of unknown function [Gryllus bimaculatus]|nr:Protein of unknown function [Gryllus bimaculatus]
MKLKMYRSQHKGVIILQHIKTSQFLLRSSKSVIPEYKEMNLFKYFIVKNVEILALSDSKFPPEPKEKCGKDKAVLLPNDPERYYSILFVANVLPIATNLLFVVVFAF